jgi:hypothetical protein
MRMQSLFYAAHFNLPFVFIGYDMPSYRCGGIFTGKQVVMCVLNDRLRERQGCNGNEWFLDEKGVYGCG